MYDSLIEFQEEYDGIISGKNGIVNKLAIEVKNNEHFKQSYGNNYQKTNLHVNYNDYEERIIKINS